jgi:hypothetical protein
VESLPADTSDNEYLYGRALYPAAPLSWLAPFCAFVCGALASGGWAWTGEHLLRLLLGLLLAGPLLGLAWAASTRTTPFGPAPVPTGRTVWRAVLDDDPPGDAAHATALCLPYTQPGSASQRLAHWLASASAWWQGARERLRRPLVELVVSTVFALAVAAQLGRQNLLLVATALFAVYVSTFWRGNWAAHLRPAVFLPLWLAWLLGHVAFGALRPASVLVAACYALTLCASLAHSQGQRALAWQVMPQVVVAATLVAIKQPLAAAVIALLATSNWLLFPMLGTQPGRERYFRALQTSLIASMLLAALALGYKP